MLSFEKLLRYDYPESFKRPAEDLSYQQLLWTWMPSPLQATVSLEYTEGPPKNRNLLKTAIYQKL